MQMGRAAARNILKALKDEPYAEFHYFDKGNMATIGRSRAIAEIGKLHLTGWIAWMAWLLIHIFFLIGFRNRAIVLFSVGLVLLHLPARRPPDHRPPARPFRPRKEWRAGRACTTSISSRKSAECGMLYRLQAEEVAVGGY